MVLGGIHILAATSLWWKTVHSNEIFCRDENVLSYPVLVATSYMWLLGFLNVARVTEKVIFSFSGYK